MAHFRERNLPWLLVLPEQWVAPGRHAEIAELLATLGFQTAMDAEALTAECDSEPKESSLSIEQAVDASHWAALATINAEAWNVPRGWTQPLLTSCAFRNGVRGWLGFQDGAPVCAAVTHRVLGYTYVAWVATLPAYRKRGFAGSLVRRAISEEHPEQVACLISGPQALSAYLTVGFTRRERFRLYVAPR